LIVDKVAKPFTDGAYDRIILLQFVSKLKELRVETLRTLMGGVAVIVRSYAVLELL
jgi:hypothetical protein